MKKKQRSKPVRTSAKRISEDGAERTVMHLSLPPEVLEPIRQRSKQKDERIGAVWDAACSSFAEKYSARPYRQYVFPHRGAADEDGYTSVWIDSRILQRCRKIADRDRVSLARVIHSAAILFLEAQ